LHHNAGELIVDKLTRSDKYKRICPWDKRRSHGSDDHVYHFFLANMRGMDELFQMRQAEADEPQHSGQRRQRNHIYNTRDARH
jgi:hypothetical protein